MIYTLTFNPALDYTVRLPALAVGKTNRSQSQTLRLGGKGLNVSAVLHALGAKTLAYSFSAGEIGEMMKKKAAELPFPVKWFQAEGESRINVKIKADTETEINASGAKIGEETLQTLKAELAKIKAGETLVLSGSLPTGMRRTLYAELMSATESGVKCVVDTSGEALKASLACRPFLVKPNLQELAELFGVEILGKGDAIKYAQKLCALGAKNALISLGADGAVFVSASGKTYQTDAPKGKVVDTVGAGDSVVAGFLWAIEQGADEETAFKTGVAAGSATAFSEGLATKERVTDLLKTM